MQRRTRQRITRFTLMMLMTIGMFIVLEVALRIVLPPRIPPVREPLLLAIHQPERLYLPDRSHVSDVSGLYEGATESIFRVSENRFIEPDPRDDPAPQRVLFLGGSVTEASAVTESDRWVARLYEPGEMATFNAGQASANSLDRYHTFEYLTNRGDRFDLVVLMTRLNDVTWMHRFHQLGMSFTVPTYYENRIRYEEIMLERNLTFMDRLADVSQTVSYIQNAFSVIARRTTPAAQQIQASNGQTPEMVRTREFISYDACNEMHEFRITFESSMAENLRAMRQAVEATGAQFLVLTEATGFRSPAESFLAPETRVYAPCDDGFLTHEDTQRMHDDFNESLLQVAQAENIPVFDLNGALHDTLNGPNGGRYTYNGFHYTPTGCELVAATLRPVLHDMLS